MKKDCNECGGTGYQKVNGPLTVIPNNTECPICNTRGREDILNGIELTAKLSAGYADSLRGPRTRGSTTEKALDELSEFYTIHRHPNQTPAGPGTEIWVGGHGGLGGRVGVKPLCSIIGDGISMSKYTVMGRVVGEHESELYLEPGFEGGELVPDRDLTFLFATEGHPDGLEPGALITWYPGAATKLMPEDLNAKIMDLAADGPVPMDIAGLPADVTVKLHNG